MYLNRITSWLPFDKSATLDVKLNKWTAYGTPTISSANAQNGNALQLDGNSYIVGDVTLGGGKFTIFAWVYVDPQSPANARVFSIYNPDTGNPIVTVRKSANNPDYLDIWFCSKKDTSVDNGYTLNHTYVKSVGVKVHITLFQNNDGQFVFYINENSVSSSGIDFYNRRNYKIFIGANFDGNQRMIGSVDEFVLFDGYSYKDPISDLTANYYKNIIFDTKIVTRIKNPALTFRYENEGRADLLTVNSGTTVTDLTQEQSVTSVGFYQPNRQKCFNIPSAKEIWCRCDIYTTSSYTTNDRIRIYSDDGNGVNGWCTYATTTQNYGIWHNNTSQTGSSYLGAGKIRSVLLHIKSGTTNGVVEFTLKNTQGNVYTDTYTGNVNAGADFNNFYIQMDGTNIYVSNLIISNEQLSIDEGFSINNYDTEREILESITLNCDTERTVNKSWRYENYGTADLLKVAGNTVNNLPESKSLTRSAFWQNGRVGCFDIPPTKDLWVKFDLYYGGTAKWRAYDRKDNKDTGIARMNSATSLVSYINGPLCVDIYPQNSITANTRKTYLLHMVSDATDGYIELWVDGEKYVADSNAGVNYQRIYMGNVNDGDYFENFYLQSDNATNLFSNVIISNRQIGLNENTFERFDVDTDREIYKSFAKNFDVIRQIISQEINQEFDVDIERKVLETLTDTFDIDRILERSEIVNNDIERKLQNEIDDVIFDTQRKILIDEIALFDTERNIIENVNIDNDIERELYKTVEFDCDLWRKIPWKITVVERNTFTPSAGQNHEAIVDNSYLQSITINLSEQQLTDNISFVIADDLSIMDSVQFQYLDYIINGRVEETIQKGVLQNCKCTCDIDEILYKQLAYEIPKSEWTFTEEYIEYMKKKGVTIINNLPADDSELKAMPSALASAHIRNIAQKLGKNAICQFSDYVSTMSTTVKSGTNYSSLIEELFGWTSRIPNLMINCFMRGNNIYCVQRGHENNVINLDNLELTLHTTRRKIVRMTWGSDVWSKTEVKPFVNSWTEGVFEPAPEETGGEQRQYNDDGLVERTVVFHGEKDNEEKTTTEYFYETLESGKKFLYKEHSWTVNMKYPSQILEETTTIHDPVRNTQSHVYTTDDSGDLLGSVVTSSNNDDRITPYQKGEGASFGAQIYTDKDGNRYIWKGVIYHTDELEKMKRTIYGVSLIDTSFPVEGNATLEYLTNAIKWLDRKTEEVIQVDLYNYNHVIDFNDRIIFNGNTYYLRSNTAVKTERIVNKQSLEFVRWF